MQVPLPELTGLYLSFRGVMSSGSVPPDSFLGGSAPRLRTLYLCGIPFQGLPKLLLSATHLVHLWLTNISPYDGYMSPEAMATSLSMLTSLEELIFQFQFQPRQSFPDVESRRPPLPTRSVLPVFTRFSFEGVSEYLEDLVSQIDTPQLYRLSTKLFHGVDFKCPELNRFISRMPTLEAYDEACLIFLKNEALVRLRQHPDRRSDHGMVEVKIFEVGQWPERQLSSLAQICTFPLRLLLTMENLYIYENPLSPHYWSDDIQNTEWLDLLLPFTAVKNLLWRPIRENFATYRARSERTHSGKKNISVACSAKCSLRGVPAIETCPERHCTVHFCAAAHQSPCRHFCLEQRLLVHAVESR
jgi:hypothetical protein